MIQVHRPDVRFHRSYLEAHDEFDGAQRDGDGDWVEEPDDGGYSGITWDRADLESRGVFERFVTWRRDRAREDSPRPTGHTPATFWWVYDDARGGPRHRPGAAHLRRRQLGVSPVIEANGGVLEDILGTQRRYWVPAGT